MLAGRITLPPPAPGSQPILWRSSLDDRRALIAGLGGTILIHLLLLLVPRSVFVIDVVPVDTSMQEIDLVLAPEETPEEALPRFIETNPEAPENEPDKTDNVSARDQQAANLEAPEELSPDRTPAREGEEDDESNRIITGELTPPVPTPPPTPASEAAPEIPPSNPAERTPLVGLENEEPVDEEGPGSGVSEIVRNNQPTPEPVEGEPTESQDTLPPVQFSPALQNLPAPTPRPRVPRMPPGVVRSQPAGVSQTGYVGVDARYSEFGDYMTRLVEAVSQHWHVLCSSRAYAERGTHVALRFRLHQDGSVTAIDTVESTAQQVGVLLARTAIERGAPYGPWTQEMVSKLGEDHVVTINFRYW